MSKSVSVLLVFDAALNLLLGLLLVGFSRPLSHLLGVPYTDVKFYPTILGAVLFGIGIALMIEAFRKPQGLVGLGLGGAVAINLSGGTMLVFWLLNGMLHLPVRGLVFLWALAIILLGISMVELLAHYLNKNPA